MTIPVVECPYCQTGLVSLIRLKDEGSSCMSCGRELSSEELERLSVLVGTQKGEQE